MNFFNRNNQNNRDHSPLVRNIFNIPTDDEEEQTHKTGFRKGGKRDDAEKRRLKNALVEAIEENEVLRERIIELEALLVEARDLVEIGPTQKEERREDAEGRRFDWGGQELRSEKRSHRRRRSLSC